MKFGKILANLCESRGITLYRLAQDSGVSRQFLGHLAKGTKQPSWEIVCKLADALDVTTDTFRATVSRKKVTQKA